MADYCTQGSSLIKIPKSKIPRAKKLLDDFIKKLEHEEPDETLGFSVEWCDSVLEDHGVVIYNESYEYLNLDNVEDFIRTLVEKLYLDDIHLFEWSDFCSKPRPDGFGGGAMAIARGFETIWVNAGLEARRQMEEKTGLNPGDPEITHTF